MGSKSDYLENKTLDHNLGTSAFTMPTQVYVGLFTTAPSDTGPGTEVSGNAYARTAANFDAAASGVTQNDADIVFPTPTPSGWGTIVGWGLFDAASGGNLLYWSLQTPNKVINADSTVQFDAAALSVSED